MCEENYFEKEFNEEIEKELSDYKCISCNWLGTFRECDHNSKNQCICPECGNKVKIIK